MSPRIRGATWPRTRLGQLFRPVSVTGFVEAEVLSVYRDHGVVPKASRSDNFNRTPENLGTYQHVNRGDLVVNRMKAWQGSLGVSQHEGIVSPDYEVLSPRAVEVDLDFIHHLVRSSTLVAQYALRSTGIRPSQWRLYWDQMKNIEVLLPPVAEQRAIADYLDRETAQIDTLIGKQERLIETLRERRSALVERSVGRGLDSAPVKPSGMRWTPVVPSHWQVGNIRRFAAMKTGHTPSRTQPEYWTDCHIPWVTLADVGQLRDGRAKYLSASTASVISDLGLANSAAELLPAGTVVLSRTASVGFSGIMPVPMATSQDYWNWVSGPQLDPEFLLWTFRAMRRDILGLMIGSTHKTIYQPVAAAISIAVPPLEEQRRIAAFLDEQTGMIDTLIVKAERFIELSKERRAALITAAVTGQIDVRSAA